MLASCSSQSSKASESVGLSGSLNADLPLLLLRCDASAKGEECREVRPDTTTGLLRPLSMLISLEPTWGICERAS
jgi:hypothetical protein